MSLFLGVGKWSVFSLPCVGVSEREQVVCAEIKKKRKIYTEKEREGTSVVCGGASVFVEERNSGGCG